MPTDPLAFHEVAELALGCICGEMDELQDDAYPGCPCLVAVTPGTPAFDACCDGCANGRHGQLTVHVEDVYATENFPARTTVVHPCGGLSYVVAIVVTIARCIGTMSETGSAPPVEELDRASRLLHVDLWAIMRALACCLPELSPPGRRKRRVSVSVVRGGQPTDCVSFEVRAFVDAGPICPCEDGVS